MLFTKQSFDAFALETLEERMEKIRSEIQPVFQTIGEAAIPLFEESCQEPFICISHSIGVEPSTLLPKRGRGSALTSVVIKWMPTFKLGSIKRMSLFGSV